MTASSRAARFVEHVIVPAAWVVFAYWWLVVLARAGARDLPVAIAEVLAAAAAVVLVTSWWVNHNLRVARRGARGSASRFVPAVFERDRLGRALVVSAALRSAGTVRVVVTSGSKLYVGEDAG